MNGTRQKTLSEQSSQTLVTEGRGEALDAEPREAEPLVAKPAPKSLALAEQLMEEVCDRENLERAWQRVRANKGGPGVDGLTIDGAKDCCRFSKSGGTRRFPSTVTASDRGAPPIRQ